MELLKAEAGRSNQAGDKSCMLTGFLVFGFSCISESQSSVLGARALNWTALNRCMQGRPGLWRYCGRGAVDVWGRVSGRPMT